ncbi:GntR family transcriptional regulator [Gynuella sp.]|uniref:GntR family transcriptional regulator n=1 Tax=Gynuella sp. TaxID=2969146 RepID=UPI003D100162
MSAIKAAGGILRKFSDISHLPKAQQIYIRLRHDIVTLTLKPGQTLSEKEIADRFDVSRQPVREAMIKLSEVGLLKVVPQKGSFVVKISRTEVEASSFIRRSLEAAIVREACHKISKACLIHLNMLLEKQQDACDRDHFEDFLLLDEEFHYSIAEDIGLIRAWSVIESQKAQMDRVRFLSLPHASPIPQLIEQHTAIVRALEAGSEEQAEAAMQSHLSSIHQVIDELEQQYLDYFQQ